MSHRAAAMCNVITVVIALATGAYLLAGGLMVLFGGGWVWRLSR